MKYSVVIPMHNESGNIEKLILGVFKTLSSQSKNFEIITVNDNSTDNSFEILRKLQRKIKQLRIINRTKNPGVGYAKRTGLKAAKGRYIITLDGDLSHNPSKIPQFIKAIKDTDMVCGSRYTSGGSADMHFSRSIISSLFNLLFRGLIGLPIKDFTSGYRIYKKEIVENIHLESKGFGIYIEIPIKAYLKGYNIIEIPIRYHKREKGISNLNYLQQGPEYLKIIAKALAYKIFKSSNRILF